MRAMYTLFQVKMTGEKGHSSHLAYHFLPTPTLPPP